jgi:hypothetical protein
MTPSEKVAKHTNTLAGRLKRLVISARHSAKDKGFDFNIDVEDVLACWMAQEGKCLYTDWEMSTITGDPKVVSIERKDNNIGYLKNNFILVCWCANRARATLNIDFFIEMCKAVSNKHK